MREGTSTHLLQVPGMTERSLSDNELSDVDFHDQSFEEDFPGMGTSTTTARTVRHQTKYILLLATLHTHVPDWYNSNSVSLQNTL